ncbi:glycosyltransferase family 39 protein [bacterium]|nr:glycosyltransferase family 39 protein [bacterium]
MASEIITPERRGLWEKFAPHLPLAAIVAAALAFRVAYILSIRGNPLFGPSLPGYDMTVFHDWAVRIAGGQLTDHKAFYQAPLYPYLLALVYKACGPSPLAVALFQALAGSLSVALVYDLGRRLFGRSAGLWAAALMALTPIFPYYEGFLLRATLVTLLNLLFLRALLAFNPERPLRSSSLAGFWLGLGALARSNALVLLPLAAFWVWWRSGRASGRNRLAPAVLMCAVTLLTVCPATLHNRIAGGSWTLVESGFAANWRIGNSLDSRGGYCEPELGLAPPFSAAFLRLEAKKLVKLASDYEEPNNMNFYHFSRYSRWLHVPVLSWGFFLAFGLAGVWLTRRRWRELLPLYGYALLYGAALVAFFVTSRFRLPLWPVTILFTGAALDGFVRSLRERRWALAAAVILPTALAAGLFKALPDKTIQAQYFQNAALAGEKAGRKDFELKELQDWARLYPADPNPLPALAQLLFDAGDKRAALAATERLTELQPGFARGWYGAGRLAYELKDKTTAARYFRRWLELEPEAPEAPGVRGFLARIDSSAAPVGDPGRTP